MAEYEHQLKAIDEAQKTCVVREMMPMDIKREFLTDQWCIGVGGLSRLRAIVTSAEIDIVARRAYGDRHEGGQPPAD